jgi:ABC-type uncharacterized transport system substrate-binding protein
MRRIITAAAFALAGGAAAAHPHIWVTGTYAFDFDASRRIEAVEVSWQFDEMYSALTVDGLALGSDGRPDPAALQSLANESLAAMEGEGWFLNGLAGGRAVAFTPEQAAAAFDGTALTLRFTARLSEPVDLTAAPFLFSAFDANYYTEIRMRGLVDVDLKNAGACRAMVEGPDEETMDRAAAISEAAWNDPGNALAGMGSMFAWWVTVKCT